MQRGETEQRRTRWGIRKAFRLTLRLTLRRPLLLPLGELLVIEQSRVVRRARIQALDETKELLPRAFPANPVERIAMQIQLKVAVDLGPVVLDEIDQAGEARYFPGAAAVDAPRP